MDYGKELKKVVMLSTTMNPSNYTYPDREERLTSRLIQSYEETRWNLEEAYVLKKVKDALLEDKEKLTVSLDVGTGLGRLISFLLSISTKVIAIDADLWRLRRAMESFGDRPNVFFLWTKGSRLDPIPPESVDFINYSHVAQHVAHHELLETLGEFYRVLKDDGWLLLLTTHSEGKEWFLVSTENGIKEIKRNEYEKLTRNSQPGKLPVRKFDVDYLEALLRDFGFKIEWKIYYHIKPEFVAGAEIEEPESINGNPAERNQEQGVEEIIKILKSINSNEMEARRKALDVALLLRKG